MKTEKADVVIIGGGIFGCAIAYYYTRANANKKVIVLERNTLCNAATSRAAALMTRIRPKKEFIPLSLETYQAVKEMEDQLGEKLDMKVVGAMHIATSSENKNELEKLMGIAKEFNETAYYISSKEAKIRAPWLKIDESASIAFIPEEAYCDPYLLGSFYARCAKLQGAEFRQNCEVNEILISGDVTRGVLTKNGEIEAGKVVIASGAWSPILAAQVGVGLPMAPVRSQYWITEKKAIFPEQSPIVILPDAQAYTRPEGNSLLFGIREKNSFYASPREIPTDISDFAFSPDKGMNDLAEVIDRLAQFFPGIYETGLSHYIAGFSGYTPDNNLSMGIVQGKHGLLLASGCVGAGISVSGGVGYAFAELAADRPNPFDFTQFRIERFGQIDPFSKEWLQRCALARSIKKSG